MRRIVAGKSSVGEMEELSAQHKVNGDQLSRLMMAGAGEVVDASLIVEGPATPITKRRMTTQQRDRIVAEIERSFAGHLNVERDKLWYSGWAATAASIRKNLLGGWKYLPQ